MNIGIVGCGVISREYAANAKAFDSFDIVACADLDSTAARSLAAEFGFASTSVDAIIAEPGIDAILNLTTPAAHVSIIKQSLAARKHVYTEKPLAATAEDAARLVEEADERGVRIGCAPDTFLGAPYQTARALIDEGAIGEPLSVTAAMLAGDQTSWHPNPDIFFADGAGPLLDMGPYYLTAIVSLLGPVRRVAGFASTRVLERTIEIGVRTGQRFTAATPTHTAGLLELESGVVGTLVASFETSGQYVAEIEVQGTEGLLRLPDPNSFDGPVRLRHGRGEWQEVPFAARGAQDGRGIGLHDMVESIGAGRRHRASAELAWHVVDVARSILRSSDEGRTASIETDAVRPARLPVRASAAH